MGFGMGQIVRCEVLQGVRKDSLIGSLECPWDLALGIGQSEIWGMQGTGRIVLGCLECPWDLGQDRQ